MWSEPEDHWGLYSTYGGVVHALCVCVHLVVVGGCRLGRAQISIDCKAGTRPVPRDSKSRGNPQSPKSHTQYTKSRDPNGKFQI